MIKKPVSILMLVCAVLSLIHCSRDARPQGSTSLAVTTTHIEVIARALATENIQVSVLVPGSSCPGHFDITPAHVRLLKDADLLIMHGWEKWAPEVIKASGNQDLQVVRLHTTGNPMVPPVHNLLASEISSILCGLDTAGCPDIKSRLKAYSQATAAAAREAKQTASPLLGIPVVCARHQKALLTWLGCRVAADYGRPEDLSAVEIGRVEDTARRAGVRLVVDNLQSGPRAGEALAADIDAAHVAISNFPLDRLYTSTLRNSVNSLVRAWANHAP